MTLRVTSQMHGATAGNRIVHAKEVVCEGPFKASPDAAAISRARNYRGPTVPVTVPFSDGATDVGMPDRSADTSPRGTANVALSHNGFLATKTFYNNDALIFVDRGGNRRAGRYQIVPVAGSQHLDCLTDEWKDRFSTVPAQFRLFLQLAEPGGSNLRLPDGRGSVYGYLHYHSEP